MGYHQAGFEVTGVDIKPQPRYPFQFHQADALEFVRRHGHEFDVIHASPPCQAYSTITSLSSTKEHPNLIPDTRRLLLRSGKPYIIENVPGAPLLNPIMLCGTMFGLSTIRHRLFETNQPVWWLPAPCNHSGKLYSVLTKSCRVSGDLRGPSSHEIGKIAMGIDWMNQYELGLSIPPAYTKYIGKKLIAILLADRVAVK